MTATRVGRHVIDAMVIGGSAGGLDALLRVLPGLDRAAPVAVFLVVHMPRQRPSLLAQVLGARTSLEVREAQDKEPARAGTLYVAPPDYHLLIERGPALALSIDEPLNFSRPSIDPLFESAAEVYGQRLCGVILSGANDDGAAGLAAVHRAGGIALVQDPASALAGAMPLAAIRSTAAAEVLSLDAMSARFAELCGAGSASPPSQS